MILRLGFATIHFYRTFSTEWWIKRKGTFWLGIHTPFLYVTVWAER